LEWFWIEFNSN